MNKLNIYKESRTKSVDKAPI